MRFVRVVSLIFAALKHNDAYASISRNDKGHPLPHLEVRGHRGGRPVGSGR